MERFRLRGNLDPEILREIGPCLVNASRAVPICLAVFLLLLLLLEIAAQNYLVAGLCALCAAACLARNPFLRYRSVQLMGKRLEESYPQGRCVYDVSFQEGEVLVNNLTSGASASFQYSALRRLTETARVFCLSTRGQQFIVVDRSGLDEGQREIFIDFLRSRCPKLKVKLVKRR